MAKLVVCFITTPSSAIAKTLARGLLEAKLAACVNIVNQVASMYVWEGKIEEDSEALMIVKTTEDLCVDLGAFVKEKHPYAVPEVIALPVTSGLEDYLAFVRDGVKGAKG